MSGTRRTAKGGTFPERTGEPLPFEYFAPPREAAGTRAVELALDVVRIRLEGLDDALADALVARFGPYAREEERPAPGALVVRCARDRREYYIDPPATAEFNPVWLAFDGGRVRYLGYRTAGWFDVERLAGELLVADGSYEPAPRAVENFLRCAVAWRAVAAGGALVHAASAVRAGRAYLFYGSSGAGKSTLSASDRRGRVISDDLTLALPRGDGGLDLVGSPFRGTYEEGAPVVGRFPLVAGFRIVQASEARVRAVPRALAFGQLVASLTFVAEAFGSRPELFARVEAAFATVPLHWLEFRRDDSYWDAIEAAGL